MVEDGSRPLRIGRMVILSRVGGGEAGIVYAAYDPELERKVAIKMICSEFGESAEPRSRLIREVQAVAQLSHPNVVAIHDAGVHGRYVWIATDYVTGKTLRAWLDERPREWRVVLPVFMQAARGVAAAHAAGLVHCDLKPTNIIVGDDGRVRVMDFAHTHAVLDTREGPGGRAGIGSSSYTAPEQLLGLDVDERADQYSLCALLMEALVGRSVTHESSARARAPHWLRRVVERGLATDRENRYSSMTALLAALGADPMRRRWALGSFALLTLVLAGWFGILHVQREQAWTTCIEGGTTIAKVWHDSARDQLRTGLTATGISFARVTAEQVMPWLDAFAVEWQGTWNEVCHDEVVERTLDAALAREARACLDEQREYYATLLAILTDPGDGAGALGIVQGAVTHVANLPRLDRCREESALRARPRPLDDGMRAEVHRLRIGLARASAIVVAGSFKFGSAEVEKVQREADALGWAPLRADVTFARGKLLIDIGDYPQAETMLEEAYFLAGAEGANDVQEDAAASLAHVVGYFQARYEEGIRWGKVTEMLLGRTGVPYASAQRAHLLNVLGTIYWEKGEFERAVDYFEQAIEISERVTGPDHPNTAITLYNLASLYLQIGRKEEGRALLERTYSIFERSLGPDHPDLVMAITGLASVDLAQGKYEQARRRYERALSLSESSVGKEHVVTALLLTNLGIVDFAQGKYEQAVTHHQRALEIREKVLGPAHPRVGLALANLGAAHAKRGAYDRAIALNSRSLKLLEQALGPHHADVSIPLASLGSAYLAKGNIDRAIAYHERALEIVTAAYGLDHLDVAGSLANLAEAHGARRDHVRAVNNYEAALAIREKAQGPDHVEVGSVLTPLGLALLAVGRTERALQVLERGLALHERHGTDSPHLASTRYALAVALWNDDGQRQRAHELMAQARAGFARSGSDHAHEVARIDGWLNDHTAGPEVDLTCSVGRGSCR